MGLCDNISLNFPLPWLGFAGWIDDDDADDDGKRIDCLGKIYAASDETVNVESIMFIIFPLIRLLFTTISLHSLLLSCHGRDGIIKLMVVVVLPCSSSSNRRAASVPTSLLAPVLLPWRWSLRMIWLTAAAAAVVVTNDNSEVLLRVRRERKFLRYGGNWYLQNNICKMEIRVSFVVYLSRIALPLLLQHLPHHK